MRSLRGHAGPHLADLYEIVFQSLADALVIIDERGRIQSFSPSAERTFGYSAAEIIGQNVSRLMPSPDRENHDEYLRKYVESGWTGVRETLVLTGAAHIVRPERETVAVRKDGSLFPARLIVSEVDIGAQRLFLGLLSDLSDRKRLERELADRIEAQTTLYHELQRAYAVIEAQKLRMQDELEVGRQIQLSMVPRRFPTLPEAEVWGVLHPAREVGGDFYEAFMPDEGHLWIGIGDVSGKGVPAALLMAVIKTLIKSYASQGSTPGEVCTRVNVDLSRDNDNGMFVTAFMASLDVRTGELRYANAGHNPPLVRRAQQTLERLATRHGPVLGAIEQAAYGESVIRLAPGDTLLVYTDGVTEAPDTEDRPFGTARLEATLMGCPSSATECVHNVIEAVEHFAQDVEQADDITVLAVRYNGAPSPAPHRFRCELSDSIEALDGAIGRLKEAVARCGGDERAQVRFAVAFDELASNVMKYGYTDDSRHAIECVVERTNGAIVAEMVDDGGAFNPLEQADPDLSLPLDERPLGGYGLHLVRRMFDEVRYRREDGRNVTTLVLRART